MKKNGFTLVEMLVAIVLLSLLIGVAVFAFRMQLMNVQKLKTSGLDSVLHYTQLTSPIESMKYYVVEDYDTFGKPMKKMHYFFSGDAKHMEFVTTNPNLGEYDAIVMLECKEDELIYKEEPLFERVDYLRPDFLEDSFQIVLYKELQTCSFAYEKGSKVILSTLEGAIPKRVIVSLSKQGKPKKFFIRVKSDNNLTKARVYDAVYPQE